MSFRTPKRLCIIGCTGSVGSSVMDICRHFPEYFTVRSLAARTNTEKMHSLIREFHPAVVSMTDQEASDRLRTNSSRDVKILSGEKALPDLVQDPEVDHVVIASSGISSIPSLLGALKGQKEISLANKESLVVAGPWLDSQRKPLWNRIRPLDSEHNAIWQCLLHEEQTWIRRIMLTASGGPFRHLPARDFSDITPENALKHPKWNMGRKISIDSATLMNKGIEILEAIFLFGLPHSAVSAVIHPDSFVHGIVELIDGSIKMIAGTPDMRIPAAICLSYPERLDINRMAIPVTELGSTTPFLFEEPDKMRFPCLRIAQEVASSMGPYPSLLIGADEIAVHAFLDGYISFPEIPEKIETVLESYNGPAPQSIEEAVSLVRWAQRTCSSLCGIDRFSPN